MSPGADYAPETIVRAASLLMSAEAAFARKQGRAQFERIMSMPIMSPEDQDYVRSLFAEKLTGDVTLRLYTQSASKLVVPGRPECPMCEVTQQLLEELVDLSDKLTLEVHDFYAERAAARAEGVEQIPALVLEGVNKGKVRFIGAPSGYEFATLLDDLIDLSTGTTSLEPASRDMLAALTEPVHIQVFVTPT